MLLYLGRLKRYKRIELLLDVLEHIPEATLEMAGEGDHREAIEHEIARRGLAPRVLMHGHVSEEKKLALLQRAWVNMTASSAEGWCLSVMEAAACGTPSVALAVGGLPESIEDGETGLLADDARGAGGEDPADRGGPTSCATGSANAARERAREFTWDRTAERNLRVLEEAREERAETSLVRARPGADRHRPRRRAGPVGDRGQRDRARVHDRVRPGARRQRLRLARRAPVRLHHPHGPRLRPADRGCEGREHGRGRRRSERGRRSASLASTPAAGHRCRGSARDPAAARAVRGAERGRGLGSGRRAAHGDALDGRVGRARRPSGAPALPARGLEHHRRGRRAARLRAPARGHRARRDRRLPRQRPIARGDRAGARRAAATGRSRTARARGFATCSPARGRP